MRGGGFRRTADHRCGRSRRGGSRGREGRESPDAVGEVGVGEGKVQVVVHEGDGHGHVVQDGVDRFGHGRVVRLERAEDAQRGGDLDLGPGLRVGHDIGLGVLGVPPVGSSVLAQGPVVQIEAVAGGGIAGPGGVLPPETGGLLALGELQHAPQHAGPGRFGQRPGEKDPEIGEGSGMGDHGLAEGLEIIGGGALVHRSLAGLSTAWGVFVGRGLLGCLPLARVPV